MLTGLILFFSQTAFALTADVLIGEPNHSHTVAPALAQQGVGKILEKKGFTGATIAQRRTIELKPRHPVPIRVGKKTITLMLKSESKTHAVVEVTRLTKSGTKTHLVQLEAPHGTLVFLQPSGK